MRIRTRDSLLVHICGSLETLLHLLRVTLTCRVTGPGLHI